MSSSVKKFRESIPIVKGQLGKLKEKLQEVLDEINSGRLVSDAMADAVAESLNACREKEDELRAIASELNISVDDCSFEKMSELAEAAEREMSLAGLREIVCDYFRLTATAKDTLAALEESKKELQKVCRLIGDEFVSAFEPYSKLVSYTKSQKDLEETDYDMILDSLGKKIVRAADKKQLEINENQDVQEWLDGSCELLSEESIRSTYTHEESKKQAHEKSREKEKVDYVDESFSTPSDGAGKTYEPPVEKTSANETKEESEETDAEKDPALLGNVNTIHGQVTVRLLKDSPASEAHPSKFMSKAKTSGSGAALTVTLPYLMTMHMIPVDAPAKIESCGAKFFARDLRYLLNHGYAGIMCFTVKGEEQKYYVPSSKAYACMRRESVGNYIKSGLNNKTRFPEPFDLLPINEWSAVFAYRCKMLTDYFDAFAPGLLIMISRGDPLHECAYTTYPREDGTNLCFVSDLVDDDVKETMSFIAHWTRVNGCMNIVIEDLDSIPVFCNKFSSEDADVKEKLRFVTSDQTGQFFDMNGNPHEFIFSDQEETETVDQNEHKMDDRDAVDQNNKPTLSESKIIHPIKPIPKLRDPSNARLDDVLKTTDKLFLYLIDKLRFVGYMDEKYVIKSMEEQYDYSADKTIELLNYLENKGYLCTYEYQGRNILCFTELLWSCVHNSSLQKVILRRFPELESVQPCVIYGVQDMPLDQFEDHLKKADQYLFFIDKLNVSSSFTKLLPSSHWNSDKKRYEIESPYQDPETGEKKSSYLELLDAKEFVSKKAVSGDMMICYSPELPMLDEIEENAYYMCLTDTGLYFIDQDEEKWEELVALDEENYDEEDFDLDELENLDLEDPESGAEQETPVKSEKMENPSQQTQKQETEQKSQQDQKIFVEGEKGDHKGDEIKRSKSRKEREKEVDSYLKDPNNLYLDDLDDIGTTEEISPEMDESLTAAELAEKFLEASSGEFPADEEMFRLVRKLLSEGVRDRNPEHCVDQVVEAIALTRLLAGNDRYPICTAAFGQLQAALPIFRENQGHSGLNLVNLFTKENALSSAAKLCAFLYGMLFPANAHDYIFVSLYKTAYEEYETQFAEFGALKHLYRKAMKCLEKVPSGFSPANLSALADSKAQQERMKRISNESKYLLDNPSINTRMNGIPELVENCFGVQSDLHAALEFVHTNDSSMRELAVSVYERFCNMDGEFDEDRLDQYLDEQWEIAQSKYKFSSVLKYDARKHVLNAFHERFAVLKEWLDETESTAGPDIEKLRGYRTELLEEIEEAIAALSSVEERDLRNLIEAALDHIRCRLQNQLQSEGYFITMLRSGYFILVNGELMVNEELNSIRFAESWRFMLRHISSTEYNLKKVYKRILDARADAFPYDNYFQLKQIGELIGAKSEEYELSSENRKRAIASANLESRYFREKLEISYAYNRISENDRERLASLVADSSDVCEFFYEHNAFGCWRAILDALRLQIREGSLQRSREVKGLLDQSRDLLREGESAELLDEAEKQITEKQNFALAEEYINLFNTGERRLPYDSSEGMKNYYLDFISDDVFNNLYSYCEKRKDSTMAKIGTSYLESNRPEGWTVRHFEAARQLLLKWPSGGANDANVPVFIGSLGFVVENSNRYRRGKDMCYTLTLKRTEKNKSDYRHPIAKFGTQLPRQMEVLCLFGKRTAYQLIDDACKQEFKDFFIVLLDATLALAERRRMAEYFFTHKNVGQASFIVIDRLLALYLAMQPDSERLPALLQCSLPYTIYQPFSNGSGSINDEMFFGRVNELASIRDMSGTSVVYGGRQLGKSALLERVEHLDNKPEKREYVVRTSIGGVRGEGLFVENLITACNETFRGFSVKPCGKISDLVIQIKRFIQEDKISVLKLLMDESDDFLDSISENKYREVQPLIDLQRNSDKRFKFVFAGLHNVSRAQNATKENGPFGQLGAPVCVPPLSPMDARKLLIRPLRYLGFKITNESQIDTILANTNYYPGIIQFFGFKLVQTLSSQYTQKYNAAKGNPPFELHDDQLADIMNSENLNTEIKRRLQWTLEQDIRYYMLARCITVLYHLNNNDFAVISSGFDIKSIREIAEYFDIHCLMTLDTQQVTVLLDEMIEMGILSKPNSREKKYLLRRRNFIDTIGPKLDELEQDIEEENKKAVRAK